MKRLIFILSIALLGSCDKKDPQPDFSKNWVVQANSDIKVYFWLSNDGADRISNTKFPIGKSIIVPKEQRYFAMEVLCLSSNCSYKVNNAPYTESEKFSK